MEFPVRKYSEKTNIPPPTQPKITGESHSAETSVGSQYSFWIPNNLSTENLEL